MNTNELIEELTVLPEQGERIMINVDALMMVEKLRNGYECSPEAAANMVESQHNELRTCKEGLQVAEPAGYLWAGVLIRAEESLLIHRVEGKPVYFQGFFKESDIITSMNNMCCESLDPETFEKWESVKDVLSATRKQLIRIDHEHE